MKNHSINKFSYKKLIFNNQNIYIQINQKKNLIVNKLIQRHHLKPIKIQISKLINK